MIITAGLFLLVAFGLALQYLVDPYPFIVPNIGPHIKERAVRYYFGYSAFLVVCPILLLLWNYHRSRIWIVKTITQLLANPITPPVTVLTTALLLRPMDTYELWVPSLLLFCVFLAGLSFPLIVIIRRKNTDIENIQAAISVICLLFVTDAFLVSLGIVANSLLAIQVLAYLAAVAYSFSLKASTNTGTSGKKLLAYPAALVIFFSALSFIYYAYMVAPPDADVTSQAQLAVWYKMGFPFDSVRPYHNSVLVGINYPPGLYSTTAIFSLLLNADINFVLLWLWLLSIIYLALAIYVLSYEIIKRRFFAFCAVLIFGGSEIYDLYNGGQVQELFSLSFGCLLLREILRGFGDSKSIFFAGLYFAGMVLTQPEAAYPFSITVLILLLVIKKGVPLRNFILSGFFALFLILPWVLSLKGLNESQGTVNFTFVYSLLSSSFWKTKTWTYALLVGSGIIWAVSHFKKRFLPLFILLFSSILLSQYHHLYGLFNVEGYSINNISVSSGAFPGIKYTYTDPYLRIGQWGIIWICFVISLGIFATFVFPATNNVFSVLSLSRRKRKVLLLTVACLLALYFRFSVAPFTSLIHPADYRALKWLQKHYPDYKTNTNNPLIYNYAKPVPGSYAHLAYLWVGPVTGKLSSSTRISNHEVHLIEGPSIHFQTLKDDELTEISQNHNIGYVFVSQFHHKDMSPLLSAINAIGWERIYNQEGAMIFSNLP